VNESLQAIIKTILRKFNIGITRYTHLQHLKALEGDINYIKAIPDHISNRLIPLLDKSRAQLKQDLFVLSELDFKRDGYFVEFGASNGIDLSNSYLLEKSFGWNGILAEPAKRFHDELERNRSCHIETDCVWRDSNSVLNFNEVDNTVLSTISAFNDSDYHRSSRKEGTTYNVHTISLVDLLIKYNAPRTIDYLSIDTEGSEYEILRNFDFDRYQFNVITCEHNFTSNREKILKLLTDRGYLRKFVGLSDFDDWYTRPQ
jgi:FkbM family methyltransferase